jgi:hypothetical protein
MMMRALKQFDYHGLRRRIESGQTFEPCSDNDRRALTLAQLAIDIEDDTPKKKKRYFRADMRAEDE